MSLPDHTVGQIRLIFQPIDSRQMSTESDDSKYFVYADRLDPVRSDGLCDPKSGLFRVKRIRDIRRDAPRKRLGAVVAATRIRSAIHVAPDFGATAPTNYTEKTFTEISKYLNLNKYSDKETYELLRETRGTD